MLVSLECSGIWGGELILRRSLRLLICFISSSLRLSLPTPSHLTASHIWFYSHYSQIPSPSFSTGVLGFLSHGDAGVIEEPIAEPEGGLAQALAVRRCHLCLHPEVCAGLTAVLGFPAQQLVCGEGWKERNLAPIHGFQQKACLSTHAPMRHFYSVSPRNQPPGPCCCDPRMQQPQLLLCLRLFISVSWKKLCLF